MRHHSDEELIELYYGEAARTAGVHLKNCEQCAERYSELKDALDALSAVEEPPPAPDPEGIWKQLQPRLIPHRKTARRPFEWRRWAAAPLAVSVALLLAVAFLGGRYWERHSTQVVGMAANAGTDPAERRVLMLLTEHLERTERLLVALQHADSPDPAESAQLRGEARELLASNLLYHATARGAGDQMLASALDRLNGVLAEVANDPQLTTDDLQRMRQGMNTQAILFEIRVLMIRNRQPPDMQRNSSWGAI